MSYVYDQRKRPQGPKNTEREHSAAPGPGMEALMNGTARPTAAQKGQSFDLDAAMKAKMENTFGDLSAVRNYTPPVREQPPLQTGPYTGPVTHAVSNASPSPSAAGPMQAKKEKETNSANREYYDDEIVKENDKRYKSLDPKKWTEITRTPTGIASWFKKTKRFKAKIVRNPWEMTRKEIEDNPANPNKLKSLQAIQNQIDSSDDYERGDTPEQINGSKNKWAWLQFQESHNNDNVIIESKKEDPWEMNEIDHKFFTQKLKIMSRMVQDFPELAPNIGRLERIDPDRDDDLTVEQQGANQPQQQPAQPLPPPKSMTREELLKMRGAYMSTSPSTTYKEDTDSQYSDNSFKGSFPLRMNPYWDADSDAARQVRTERSNSPEVSGGKTTDLSFAGNHEMGHMLNFLLVKEINRNLEGDARKKANNDDFHYDITADKIVERALEKTMSKDDFEGLVRYTDDNEVKTDDNPVHKRGQIDLRKSGLGATANDKGYTSKYGSTNAAEFFAEAFADVYQNGEEARKTSIELVKLYKKNMKYYKALNKGKKLDLSEDEMKDIIR